MVQVSPAASRIHDNSCAPSMEVPVFLHLTQFENFHDLSLPQKNSWHMTASLLRFSSRLSSDLRINQFSQHQQTQNSTMPPRTLISSIYQPNILLFLYGVAHDLSMQEPPMSKGRVKQRTDLFDEKMRVIRICCALCYAKL